MSGQCTGVILAGGKSSRMGSDKAELRRGDGSMLAFCRRLLEDAGVNDVLVSRNTGEGIRDIYPDRGPLGGIYSTICKLKDASVLIVPVDMPLLRAEDLATLVAQGTRLQAPVYYQDCYLPLFMPVNDAVIDYLRGQLSSNGNLKVRGLAQAFGAQQLARDDLTTLVNTNTPQQWQQTQPLITSRG